MDDAISLGAVNLGVILSLMLLLWLVSMARRDASIVDPFWAAGFVVVAWVTFWLTDSAGLRAALILTLSSLWGLRLSLFLLWRNSGKGEDYRYRTMREKHGERFWLVSLLTVFGLQGLLMWIVSWPVQFGQLPGGPGLGWLDAAGAGLWAVGMIFESVGDFQLARFKADPHSRGRVMDRGLWRYTRHPNYFGDFCVWWGLYLIAAAAGAWWTVVSPLLMAFLLLKFSGVSLLESTITERRPEYADYIRRTSAFFPWAPRKQGQEARPK